VVGSSSPGGKVEVKTRSSEPREHNIDRKSLLEARTRGRGERAGPQTFSSKRSMTAEFRNNLCLTRDGRKQGGGARVMKPSHLRVMKGR